MGRPVSARSGRDHLTDASNQNFRRISAECLAWLRDRKPELTPERIQSLIRQLNSTDHEQQLGAAVEIIGRFTRHDPGARDPDDSAPLRAAERPSPGSDDCGVGLCSPSLADRSGDREVLPPPEGFTDTDLDQITAALARTSDRDIAQREHLIDVLGNCR